MIDEAVILLGGMGTRLLPYTKTIPKEMLPIYDVPMIFLLVKEAYLSGIKKIIFVVTKHNKDVIEKFFSDDKYLNDFLKDKPDKMIFLNEINKIIKEMEFIYVYQDLKGTYGALYSSKDYIKNDNFIVMYGDDLIYTETPLTKELIDEYKRNNKMQVAVFEKDINDLPNNGIVKFDNNNYLIDLVNKYQIHSNCQLHGRMLLNKKIFNIKNSLEIHKNDEYYLSYALLKFPGEVKVFKYNGEYFNIGERNGYIKASIFYALKRNDTDLLKYIKSL